jgi:hypothetical protein
MTKAWASVGSRGVDPCYSVDIDIDGYGGVSYDTDTGFRCLSPQGAWTGSSPITVVSDGAQGWIVTVGIPGARISQGYAKARDSKPDPNCRPGTLTAANAMQFAATKNAHGDTVFVRDVELTFCVPPAG